MKKIGLFLLIIAMATSLVGCGGKGTNSATDNNDSFVEIKSAEDLLTNVWSSYNDDDKFPIAGGDMDNSQMDKPGKFDVGKAEDLDSFLAFPKDKADLIDDAASIMHMMNGNTYTCAAYHVKDSSKLSEVTAAIRDNIDKRQWICGSPDKMVIYTVDKNYIVVAFGDGEIIDTFKTNFMKSYKSAKTYVEKDISVID